MPAGTGYRRSWWVRLLPATLFFGALIATGNAGYAESSRGVSAQPVPVFDATGLTQPTRLSSTWLIHAGDDPAYAQPGFDDTGWPRFNPATSIHTLLPQANPGVIWYRLHVKVSGSQAGLALQEQNLSAAFTVYSNGVDLIHAGVFQPYKPYNTEAKLIAQIPSGQIATGSLVIALRVHLDDKEWAAAYPGLYPGNLVIGRQDELTGSRWFAAMRYDGEVYLEIFVYLSVGFTALFLYSSRSGHEEYLWAFLLAISLFPSDFLRLYSYFHAYPAFWRNVWIFSSAAFWFRALMYFAFVRQKMGWRIGILIALACVTDRIDGAFPALTQTQLLWLASPVLLVEIILPVLLIIHWRRGNREAGILLVPLLLGDLVLLSSVYVLVLRRFPGHAGATLWAQATLAQVGPFKLVVNDAAIILSWMALALIILLRSKRTSRENVQLENEMAAAQEIQQVLLPERVEAIPGFHIETAYFPARQVGGDFFQVLPTPEEGMLVVVGDVAGKGLPAAMMVSVLVGAARTAAAYTCAPDEVLEQLNDRIVGRTNSGFSTAIAAHIERDGVVTLASAGHLNPYLNGEEIEFPGALPLGLLPGVQYETRRLRLHPGNRLTFYSDGVVEAQNHKGKLLGFDRARELSTKPADKIAEAALSFGQCDDITVVSVFWDAGIAAPTLRTSTIPLLR